MKYYESQIVFQEVPNEISLAFSISGCPLKCKGCHSAFTWDKDKGAPLNSSVLKNHIKKYNGLISCVLFYGGEWAIDKLLCLTKIVKELGLKVCLYTGLEDVPQKLKKQLDFIKVGPWNESLGGLENPNTNQKFINLNTGKIENHYFTTRSI